MSEDNAPSFFHIENCLTSLWKGRDFKLSELTLFPG